MALTLHLPRRSAEIAEKRRVERQKRVQQRELDRAIKAFVSGK